MLEVNRSFEDCVWLKPALVNGQRELRGKHYAGFFVVDPMGVISLFRGRSVYGWTVVGIPGSEER